jgi:hypothetical protein
MTYVARNGTIRVSKNYYMRYLKTLMYQGVEYALYERKLPKEFTLYAGQGANAPVLIANVVNIKQETDNGTPIVLSTITSQTCSLDVMPSTNLDADESIEATELENINAQINEINELLTNKQDKIDDTLETNNKSVVGAINENKSNISINATNIQSNTQDISSVRNELDDIRSTISSGENYVGTLTTDALPSDQTLNTFVMNTAGRSAGGGDVVIVIVEVAGQTDKNYKYIYNGKTWSGYEIPPIELASNGTAGLISGTYNVDTTDTLVDISGGKILNIYVKDDNGSYRNIKEYLNTTTTNIGEIIDGTQVVGEAMKALEDSLGNNIVNTYLTQALGASKQYVRDYAMPRQFNDVYFITSSGYQTSVPTEPASGVQFSTDTNAVGSFELFHVELNNTADFELSSKNGYSNNIYISASVDTTATLRLTTQYKKSGQNWADLNVELSSPIKFTAGDIEKVMFGNPFTSLGEEVITLTNGDNIRQVLEVVTQSSTATTFNVYSNDVYPSIFNLTSQSYTMGAVEDVIGRIIMIGADGFIQENNAVFVVQNVDSYLPYRTNQRKFLFTLQLPVVGEISDDLVLRIEFGDRVYNVYSFIEGGNVPLTIGALKGLSKYNAEIGYSYYVNLIFIETSDIEGFVIDPATGNGGGGDISIDNETITKNSNDQIQAVAIKDGVTRVGGSIAKANFSGVVELETVEQYQALRQNGFITVGGERITYSPNTVYVVPNATVDASLESRVAVLEGTITDLSQDVSMALKIPVSTLPATELVGVNTSKSQVMIEVGTGLTLQNNVLSASGGVQSTDFSKNTETKFGDWSVFKRKKISNTTLSVQTTGTTPTTSVTMQLTESLSQGDIFDIEYGVGASFEVPQVARFVWKGGTTTMHSFEIPVVVTNGTVVYNGSCYGYINNSGLLTIQNWVLYQLTPNQGFTTGSIFEIYNVYKVK